MAKDLFDLLLYYAPGRCFLCIVVLWCVWGVILSVCYWLMKKEEKGQPFWVRFILPPPFCVVPACVICLLCIIPSVKEGGDVKMQAVGKKHIMEAVEKTREAPDKESEVLIRLANRRNMGGDAMQSRPIPLDNAAKAMAGQVQAQKNASYFSEYVNDPKRIPSKVDAEKLRGLCEALRKKYISQHYKDSHLDQQLADSWPALVFLPLCGSILITMLLAYRSIKVIQPKVKPTTPLVRKYLPTK